jgi:hypothetical protein
MAEMMLICMGSCLSNLDFLDVNCSEVWPVLYRKVAKKVRYAELSVRYGTLKSSFREKVDARTVFTYKQIF